MVRQLLFPFFCASALHNLGLWWWWWLGFWVWDLYWSKGREEELDLRGGIFVSTLMTRPLK